MKKRVVIFTGYFLPFLGGIERYTDNLCKELKNNGCDITIVTSNHDPDNLSYYEMGNFEIYRLPIKKVASSRYPIPNKNKLWRKMINEIENKNIDYIFCNTRFQLTTLIGCGVAKKKNIVPVVVDHGSDHFTVNNKVLDFFGEKYEHFLTNKVKKYNPSFYGVSNRCTEWLKHFDIEASGVFYNSIDGNAYEKYKDKFYVEKNEKEIIISYAGRIIKEKGVYLLLESFLKLSNKYNNIKLVVAGDGPILDDLKANYVNDNISFPGKLNYDQVMSLYNSSDIFVHPSMYPEGLPTSILEAGLMKCAVIATDRGGTIEVINSDSLGIIMEENEVSLTESLEKLINDKKLMKKLASNLHDRINDNFTWEVTSKKVLNELEKINHG